MRRTISLLFWIICASAAATGLAKSERHVLVVVWDGMRPDFVSEQNTPTLWKLAREGITFRNHHAVYPSATMVNGTAMVTGVYPGNSGIIANHVYRPDIDSHHAIDVETVSVVNKGDELSGGRYISASTIAELVQRAGARSVVAAAKTVGLLLDRHASIGSDLAKLGGAAFPFGEGERMTVRGSKTRDNPKAGTLPQRSPLERRASSENKNDGEATHGAKRSVTLFAGESLPSAALAPITQVLGPFPSAHLQKDSWTTKALIDVLWRDGLPAVSILWLGEPDLTQHENAPGAPAALAAIKSADENLAAVLSALGKHKARGTTDVFVVSDHGFSTIRRSIDMRKILNEAGFTATTEFSDEPKPGDIMLAGNGGSVLFYVIGHDATVTRRLVESLQQSDFAGLVFTKQAMEGTFELERAKIQNDCAPDVVMAFRWNDSKNQFGIAGMIDADWQRAAGKGTHATLSRFDIHGTLVAAGPDFKQGEKDDLSTGNVDLAPTILQILGMRPVAKMDGRILSEAMIGANSSNRGLRSAEPLLSEKPETKTIEATKHFPMGMWRQSLQISRVGSTVYLDQGNGGFVASETAANDLQAQRRAHGVNSRIAIEPDRK